MFYGFIDFHNQILIARHKNLNLNDREFNQHSSDFRCSLSSNYHLNIVINYFTNLVFIMWIFFLNCIIHFSSLILILLWDSQSLIWLHHDLLRRHIHNLWSWKWRHIHNLWRWKWRHSSHLLRIHLSLLLHHHVVLFLYLHLLLSRCAIL